MEQSAKMRKRGQINVVIKTENKQIDQHESKPVPFPTDSLINHVEYQEMMKEFDNFVGLNKMKSFIHEMYAWLYLNKIRNEKGLKTGKQALHMVFKGNPGTGKTTVARFIAKMLKEMNVLDKGHLLEVERADLVGEYIGHTAQKTRELVEKAIGGILFIDEAYSLARGGEKDFGKEAIDTLVKKMEDEKDNFVLILAGYPAEMDRFLSLNPGLPSRFPMIVSFPNYSIEELIKIMKGMAEQRDYQLSTESLCYMRELLVFAKDYEHGGFSNGRFIRNLLEKAIRMQAVRLLHENNYKDDALLTLEKTDFSRAFEKQLFD